MAKPSIKNFNSIKTFEQNNDRTKRVIYSLSGDVALLGRLSLLIKMEKIELDDDIQKSIEIFKISEADERYLYQIGYIALFANFEFFMLDFLREALLKFPKSLPKDTNINFEEILTLTSVKQIKEHIVDKAAVSKSFNYKDWAECLKKYGVKVFKSDAQLKNMELFNEYRNALMHSGGKVSSKLRNHLIRSLRLRPKIVKLNEDIKFDPEKFFNYLDDFFQTIIGNFKNT